MEQRKIKNLGAEGVAICSEAKPDLKQMTVRVTQREFVLLRNLAAERGQNQADLLRELIEPALRILLHTRG